MRSRAFIAVCLRLTFLLNAACNKSVDFDDNPALLVSISDQGLVSLDTYQGALSGHLRGVRWEGSPEYLKRARGIIDTAMRDKVAFAVDGQGEIEIWYPTKSGAENLNKQLQKLERE